MTPTIRPLLDSDDRTHFCSGNKKLDDYFRKYAGQHTRRQTAVTHVAVDEGRVVGFVTLTVGSLEPHELREVLRRGLPRHPIGVMRIARLASDSSVKGKGVGSALVRYCLEAAREVRRMIGMHGIVVDAKPDAVAFYKRLGFEDAAPVDATSANASSDTTLLFLAAETALLKTE